MGMEKCHLDLEPDVAALADGSELKRFYDKHGFAIKEMIPNYYKRIDPPDCYILHRSLV